MSDQPSKTGFSFGVILGAVLGTGAVILSSRGHGQDLQKKLTNTLNTIKDKYPDQINAVEDVLGTALSEARTLTRELKDFRVTETKATRTPKKKLNTFTRSGKPVTP